MSYGPKSKFEIIVSGIFGILFYGALALGAYFIVGYTIYALIVGDRDFFKKQAALAIPVDVIVIIITVVVIKANRKEKKS